MVPHPGAWIIEAIEGWAHVPTVARYVPLRDSQTPQWGHSSARPKTNRLGYFEHY